MYSYAVEKPLSIGHKSAGYLPSLFWGFITLGRFISIPVSSRMRPATMVFINVVSGQVASFPFLETQILSVWVLPLPKTFCSGPYSARIVKRQKWSTGILAQERWSPRTRSLLV